MSTEIGAKVVINKKEKEGTYQFLASIEELKKEGQLTKWIDDHDILLYEYEGKIKAISNICRHFGGPVGFHKSKDGVFTCLWHNWKFSMEDGACLTCPSMPLRQYEIKIVNKNVYINLNE